MPQDAHVREPRGVEAAQQRANAGQVHLHAKEVDVRPRGRNGGGRFPHAEADLQHDWRVAPENRAPIERRRRLDAIAGQQFVACALLCR